MGRLVNVVVERHNGSGKIKRRVQDVCDVCFKRGICVCRRRHGDSVSFRQRCRIELFLLDHVSEKSNLGRDEIGRTGCDKSIEDIPQRGSLLLTGPGTNSGRN